MTSSILDSMMKNLSNPADEHTTVDQAEKKKKFPGDESIVVEEDSDDSSSYYTNKPPPPPPYHEDNENMVSKSRDCMLDSCSRYASLIKNILYAILLITYTVYFGFAIKFGTEMATTLVVLTALVLVSLFYIYIRDNFGDKIYEHCLGPVDKYLSDRWHIIQWLLYPSMLIVLVLYLLLFVIKEVRQLQSVAGLVIFFGYTFFTSKHPSRVRWRPVIWGFSIQFLMAILVLRWEAGYNAVNWMAEWITRFMNFAYDGAAVIFGDPWMVFHAFAFMGMSVIIYMGSVLAMLYYAGITQVCAGKCAWLMQRTMGTTAIETLGVASNIFLNGMDTMLMLRNYLHRLTESEFHCFLVGGHATVAGFIFGLFVLFGAPPQHLLSAAVMSAPAVIAIAKLNWPETETSVTLRVEDVQLERGPETNIFEAAANGCGVAAKTVAAVLSNFIAFLALLAWINSVLSKVGGMVGYPELSFELICSYLFWPISLIMGVDVADCREVSKLIGIKIFTSEILGYQELGVSTRAGRLSERSRAIATYALCGFCSLSTLAMAVGIWNAVCPAKTRAMAGQMARAIVNANLACFMTACIAGLMYSESVAESAPPHPATELIFRLMSAIPSYRDLMGLVGM